MENHSKHYTKQGFWKKIRKYGVKIPLATEVVAMYYCLQDPKTPLVAKGAIISALGYLIFPLDVAPDTIPVAGLLDDAGVLSTTLGIIGSHITKEHKEKAKEFWNK